MHKLKWETCFASLTELSYIQPPASAKWSCPQFHILTILQELLGVKCLVKLQFDRGEWFIR